MTSDAQDRITKQLGDEYVRVVITPDPPGPDASLVVAQCYNQDDQLVREVAILPTGDILADTRWPEMPVA